MKDGFLKDVAKAIRDDCKLRELQGRERWLDEHELPAVFQGLQSAELRSNLNHGFGAKIAALYGAPEMDDRWFWRVFDADAAAQAWRKGLVESLWAAL
jgi:hypothetical protein